MEADSRHDTWQLCLLYCPVNLPFSYPYFTHPSSHPVETHAKAEQRALVSWDERRSCPNLLWSSRSDPCSSRCLIFPESAEASIHGPMIEKRESTRLDAPRVTSLLRAPSRISSFVPGMSRWR